MSSQLKNLSSEVFCLVQTVLARRLGLDMTEEYKVSVVSGGQPLPLGFCFTSDGRHFIVPFNNQLKVYFITTRQCVRSIKFNDVNDIDFEDLVAIRVDPENENFIWCFLAGGEVLIINWKEKLVNPVLKRVQLSKSKDDFVLQVLKFTTSEFTLVIGKNSSNPHTRSIVSYKVSAEKEFEYKPTVLASTKNVVLFSVSNDYTKVVFLTKAEDENTAVMVFNAEDSSVASINQSTVKSRITTLAVSNNGVVAAGTASGVIHIFYENTIRLLKWHIDQVESLEFSKDSNYLLSGGSERVLVFWQLDTEKQQFLPRLNGEIVNINDESEEYYTLTLKLDNQDHYEILVLSSVDLQSRLSITGPRQSFNSDLKNNLKKLHKLYKKSNIDTTRLKYDFTTFFKIHPTSKQLYFASGSNLQVYDYFKNEQVSLQKITDSLQMGKVRSEQKLLDPVVKNFVFTSDGKWMATLEEVKHGEVDNLLSKDDLTYVLKIWKFVEQQSKSTAITGGTNVISTNSWELITKIINPHGLHVPVISLISAPHSYFKGLAFLTADNNGGVRLWRPTGSIKDERVSWSLRKLKPSTGIVSSSVSLNWSEDASLVFLGFESCVVVIDTDTFEEIESDEIQILNHVSGSRIKYLSTVDNNLVLLTKTTLKTINLLTLEENNLVIGINSPKNAFNLIDTNHTKSLIAVAVNYYNLETKALNAKLFIFSPYSKIPILTADHDHYISAIKWNQDHDLIFIDSGSRIGIVSSSKITKDTEKSGLDFQQEMNILIQNASSASAIYRKESREDNSDEVSGYGKNMDVHTFSSLFENIEGIQLETLFERVMQIIQ